MSHWKIIVKLARKCLIVLAVAMTIALAIYAGTRHLKNQAQASLGQSQQMESSTQAALDEKQSDFDYLQAEIDHFSELRRQGLVGTGDRAGWVEQLKASQQRMKIQGKLSYTLHSPRLLTEQANPTLGTGGVAMAIDAEQSGEPQFHDLEVEVAEIHEAELLALLSDFKGQASGRFRVEVCNLSGRTATGLSARCTLRFFTQPEGGPLTPSE